MLLDDGAVHRAPDGSLSIGDLDAVSVPPTIQALLAARLDRLGDAERRTIERASVVGKEFGRLEVAELTPESGRDQVSGQLMALVRKELIRPDRRRNETDDTFRFRHLLIRDAAYESLPKAERADLHERFADWLERTAGDRLAELDEIVGYHLDQARTYRLALGPEDERSRGLALRARSTPGLGRSEGGRSRGLHLGHTPPVPSGGSPRRGATGTVRRPDPAVRRVLRGPGLRGGVPGGRGSLGGRTGRR